MLVKDSVVAELKAKAKYDLEHGEEDYHDEYSSEDKGEYFVNPINFLFKSWGNLLFKDKLIFFSDKGKNNKDNDSDKYEYEDKVVIGDKLFFFWEGNKIVG